MQTRTSLLAKSTSLLGAAVALLFAGQTTAQVNYSFDFNANATGWTGNIARVTSGALCNTGSMRRNLYSFATTGTLISPLTGTSTGVLQTISYSYKCQDYNSGGPAPTPWGSFAVEYGPSATGPWTNIATVTNEPQSAPTCLVKSHNFTAPAGPLFVRWNASWGGGDYYLVFDNVSIVPTPVCTTPAPGNTIGPAEACSGANFTLSLQNATPGAVVSYQWWESTISGTGPWTAVGTNVATHSTSQAVDTWYYCDVTCSVGPTTVPSTPVFVPMSVPVFPQDWSTAVVAPNCWAVSGNALPDYNAVSGYGVGTGSVRFNFYNVSTSGHELILTSPVFPALVGTNVVNFDVAGAKYTGGEVDQIVLEESNDGGLTWTTIIAMDNDIGGLLNTLGGTTGSDFVPTAAQWASRSYPVSAGTDRIRFRGISDYGNSCFVDNVNFTAGLPAYHATLGTGCYNSFNSALVEEFAGSAAAKAVLDGNSMVFVNMGSTYVVHWEAGGASTFVAPTIGATTLAFAPNGDDGTVTITPTYGPSTIPGGTTADWTVSTNGVLTAAATGDHGTSYTPVLADIAPVTNLNFYTWRDWNADEVGSGPIQSEEVGNMLYITWNGVEAYGSPSPNVGTWQFQIDMSTGNVRIVWVSFETSSSTSPVIVGCTLAGASATPPSADLTATPVTMGGDIAAMTLSAIGAPINGGPAANYTINNIPESFPGSGSYNSAVVFSLGSIPGGYDLGTAPNDYGAAGCNGYVASMDIFVVLGTSATPSVTFPIAWSIPSVPLQLWMQAVGLFTPGSLPGGLNAGGVASSNALEIYVENF